MSSILFSALDKYPPTLEKNNSKNNKFPILIYEKFYEFYQTKKFVDIDLIVGPNTFTIQTHRVILSAASDYFLELLTKNPNIVFLEIKEVDEVAMECILRFMYTSSIHFEAHSAEAIIRAAVLFKMYSLIEVYFNLMEKKINSDNCLGFARCGLEYDKPVIVKKAMAFAHEHFKEIRNGTDFLKTTPEVLRELFSSDFLRVDSEKDVLESLLDWANFDPANRHKLVSDLLSVVRFELLSPQFITYIRESMRHIPKCDDVIFGWITCHINNQELKIIPKIRTRNMNHTYSIVCGESTEDWYIMRYNGIFDTWSSREVLPNSLMKRSYFKSVVTPDNRIIIAGGRMNEVITDTVESLDLQSKTWTDLPAMREARVGHVMALLKGNLFVMGGFDNRNNTMLSVERYNFQTPSWMTMGNMPGPISYSHRRATVNDRLYIMDVYQPKKLKCFDGVLFEWTQLDFDHDVQKGLDMVAIGDELYLCLVESNVKSIERFSPAENKWTVLEAKGIEKFVSPRMFAFGNKLIFWGKASDLSGKILVEMYDPENENFTSLTPLTELLYDLNIK